MIYNLIAKKCDQSMVARVITWVITYLIARMCDDK